MDWKKFPLPPLCFKSNKSWLPGKQLKYSNWLFWVHTGLVCWSPFPGITVQGSGIWIHTVTAFLGCLLCLSDGAVGCLPESEWGSGAGGLRTVVRCSMWRRYTAKAGSSHFLTPLGVQSKRSDAPSFQPVGCLGNYLPGKLAELAFLLGI